MEWRVISFQVHYFAILESSFIVMFVKTSI